MKLKSILQETVVEKKLREEFDHLGSLSDEIEKLSQKMNALKKTRDPLLVKFTKTLENTKDQVLQSENYVMAVKRKGYERFSPSYKIAFLEALKKVNRQTQKILNEILADATSIAKIATSTSMIKKEPIDEGPGNLINTLKYFRARIISWRKANKEIEKYNKELRAFAKKYPDALHRHQEGAV